MWTRLRGGFTSYDAYDQMGYLYLAAAFDGAGWLPIHHNTVQESLQAEIAAMVEPMKRALRLTPMPWPGRSSSRRTGTT